MDSPVGKKNLKKYILPPNIKLGLQAILESAQKGFAYQILQLEISLELDAKPIGKTKIDDISRLIQLYMIGVQALEGAEDSRFVYFSKKLQSLMLKRTVVSQLHSANNSLPKMQLLSPKNKQQKRKQHEIQMFYNKDQHQKQKVKEIVQNVEQKLKSYQGIISNHLKKQQQKIKQRIQVRRMKSETGSVKKLDLNSIQEKYNRQLLNGDNNNKKNSDIKNNKNSDIFDDLQQIPKKNTNTQRIHKNLVVTTQWHDV